MECKYSELNIQAKTNAVNYMIKHEQERLKTQYPLTEEAKKLSILELKRKEFKFEDVAVDLKGKKIRLISNEQPYGFVRTQLPKKEKEVYEKLTKFRRIQIEIKFDFELTNKHPIEVTVQRDVLGDFFFNRSNDMFYKTLKEELNFILKYDISGTVKDKHRLLELFQEEIDQQKIFTDELAANLADDVVLVANQYVGEINNSLNSIINDMCNQIFDLYNQAHDGEVMKSYYNKLLEVNETSYGHRYKFKENGEIVNFKD